MKSLRESLFDSDLVSKDITFGDLFKFEKSTITTGARKLTDLYKKTLIKKDSGVSSDDPADQIINGLVKMILNLPVDSNIENDEFRQQLNPFMKYYTSTVNNSSRLRARMWPWPFGFKNGNHLILDGWTISEPEKIKISLCCLELHFIRK